MQADLQWCGANARKEESGWRDVQDKQVDDFSEQARMMSTYVQQFVTTINIGVYIFIDEDDNDDIASS